MTIKIRIQNRRAYPDKCPACGQAIKHAEKVKGLSVLAQLYDSPSYLSREPVPGWRGFYQWWFNCCCPTWTMADWIYKPNPFLKMLTKDL